MLILYSILTICASAITYYLCQAINTWTKHQQVLLEEARGVKVEINNLNEIMAISEEEGLFMEGYYGE